MKMCALEAEAIDPAALHRAFVAGLGNDTGAVTSFTGLTRGRDANGSAVAGLFLDHHPRRSAASLEAIANAATARFSLTAAAVVHRVGAVAAGAPVVWVAAAAAHRRAAFEALDYLMDRVKTEALLWKREDGPASTRWIEPTAADHEDRARWG